MQSERQKAQLEGAQRLSRPGREARTPEQDEERRKAFSIGRTLSLEVMEIVHEKVRRHKAADRELLEDRDRKPESKIGENRKRELESDLMTNFDLKALMADLNDRFGFPKRSEIDVAMDKAPPVIVRIEGGLPWPGVNGREIAAGAGRGGDDPGVG